MSYFNGNYLSQTAGQFASFDRGLSHRSESFNHIQRNTAEDDLEISQLQREVSDLSGQEYDCESVQKETKQIEAQVQSLTEKIVEQNAEARTQREAMLLHIAKAQAAVKTQQKKLERVEAEYRKYLLENADAEMLVRNRQFKAHQTTDVLRDATIAYQNVKNDFAKVRNESKIITQDKAQIKNQIQELEDDLDKKMTEFKLLKERIVQQQNQLANFESLFARMEAKNAEMTKEESQFQKKIDETDYEIFSLMAQLTSLMNEVEQLKNEAFGLRSDILSLEAKIIKRQEAIKENEKALVDLDELVQTEQQSIQQKVDFIGDLREKEQEKQQKIEEKKQDIQAFKEKTELLKRFSMKAFEEFGRYVKLDKTIKATFARGYQFNFAGEFSQSQIHSEVKLY